jgi:hypothetical protein
MKEQDLGHGQKIVGFDSLEEMFAYQERKEQEASASTVPEQWAIARGDRVIRIHHGLVIFGHIFTEAEFLMEDTVDDENSDELLAELRSLRGSFDRGYRYGKWYSVVKPSGEYGSAHVCNLWNITHGEFETGRRKEWKAWPELITKVTEELGAAQTRKEQRSGKGKEV